MTDQTKIIRFVDISGMKKLLRPDGTFILRNFKYYRDLEEFDKHPQGDKAEGFHEHIEPTENPGISIRSTIELSGVLISCWSVYSQDLSKYWSLFDADFGIVSTADKVYSLTA